MGRSLAAAMASLALWLVVATLSLRSTLDWSVVEATLAALLGTAAVTIILFGVARLRRSPRHGTHEDR
jgi:hypothetical protein